MANETAVLLISCPDQKGLVAGVSNFIYRNGGNIVHAGGAANAFGSPATRPSSIPAIPSLANFAEP